ncbi:MAG TPA: hypothetical protein VD789_04835 [Thermomicrobiales bacterium]|nr:hypothetical protein [Thermomicrobiales bacterium]
MERTGREMREKHFRPKDVSALALVLALAIAIVAIVSFVLF